MVIEALPMVGKNAQQIRAMVLRQVKAYKALLHAFCAGARVEAALMVHLQACAATPLQPSAHSPAAPMSPQQPVLPVHCCSAWSSLEGFFACSLAFKVLAEAHTL